MGNRRNLQIKVEDEADKRYLQNATEMDKLIDVARKYYEDVEIQRQMLQIKRRARLKGIRNALKAQKAHRTQSKSFRIFVGKQED